MSDVGVLAHIRIALNNTCKSNQWKRQSPADNKT